MTMRTKYPGAVVLVLLAYGPKTQPLSNSWHEKELHDSLMQWIEPVPQHFETVESLS